LLIPVAGVPAVADARLWVVAVATVTGLAVGSFLNVVVYRVPRRLSVVRPGSFCPACGTPIRSSDNVPVVSWLILRGRCRHCGEPISPRYLVVELATGVLFGAIGWTLGAHWAVPGMCVLGATILTQAFVELDGMTPPAGVSLVGTGLGTALLAAAAVADSRWWRLGGTLIGIGVAAGALVVWRARPGGRVRPGDPHRPWSVLPAGAVRGWVGPLGPAVGGPATAVVLVVLELSRRTRSAGARSGPEGSQGSHGAGLFVAAAVGAVAAVIAALVSGSSIGL